MMRYQANKIAVFLTIILTYCSFFLSDVITIGGKNISLAEVLLFHQKALKFIPQTELFQVQYGDWFHILLPLSVGISCIPFFCDEINSNYYMLLMHRCGKRAFIESIIKTQLYISILIFIVTSLMYKISISVYGISYRGNAGIYEWLNSGVLDIVLNEVSSLLYFIMVSGFVLLMAVIFTDVYISITCVFLLNYLALDYEMNPVVSCVLAIIVYAVAADIIKRRWAKC